MSEDGDLSCRYRCTVYHLLLLSVTNKIHSETRATMTEVTIDILVSKLSPFANGCFLRPSH